MLICKLLLQSAIINDGLLCNHLRVIFSLISVSLARCEPHDEKQWQVQVFVLAINSYLKSNEIFLISGRLSQTRLL